MGEIFDNTYFRERERGFPNPPWLPVGDDPRKVCTLLLGDGFTQDFLQSTGLANSIQCKIEDLFPHKAANYLSTVGDQFNDKLFWDKNKWPKLYEYYEATKFEGREFFKNFPKTSINPDVENGLWTFDQNSIGFELRSYLWHLFRYFHYTYLNAGSININNWKWRWVLYFLLSEFSLRIISFNYDLILEYLLRGIRWGGNSGIMPITAVEGHNLETLKAYQVGSVIFMKPHGSLDHYISLPRFADFGQNANPWIAGDKYTRNVIVGIDTQLVSPNDKNMFPVVPDLVPPGHYGEDICNPASQVHEYSKYLIGETDLFISCGLSGEDPDTKEVSELLVALPKIAKLFQVGLTGDDNNPVGKCLRDSECESYNFIEADRLYDIHPLIKDSFDLRWNWNF